MPKELPVVTAEVVEVTQVPWPTVVRTQGSLVADEVVTVGAKVAGRVLEVKADLGDLVETNTPIVVLDKSDFELAVEQALASLVQSKAAVGLKPDDPVDQLDPVNAPPVREQKAIWDEARTKTARVRRLATLNATSETELDEVIAAEEVAAARYASAVNSVNEKIATIKLRTVELDVARQHLADATVAAPFEGIVQQRLVAPGSFVQVGQPTISMLRTNPLRFQGTVPERYARELAVGQQVDLKLSFLDDDSAIEISRISPSLDLMSRSLTFEAIVPNPSNSLRAGLFAEGTVTLDPDSTAVAVRTESVVEFAGTEKAWKIADGKVVEQIVTTGRRRDGWVEIVDGLSSGDVVLADASEGKPATWKSEVVAGDSSELPQANAESGSTETGSSGDG